MAAKEVLVFRSEVAVLRRDAADKMLVCVVWGPPEPELALVCKGARATHTSTEDDNYHN